MHQRVDVLGAVGCVRIDVEVRQVAGRVGVCLVADCLKELLIEGVVTDLSGDVVDGPISTPGLGDESAKELAKRGITVNAIAPGVVLTEMGMTIPEEVRKSMLKNIPLGRFGEPDEIAHTVQFILENEYVNGRCIEVDGALRL